MAIAPMQTVVLGPRMDLHPGVHHALVQDPPAQVCYRTRDARHHFACVELPASEPEQLPFERFHFGEFVDFGPGPQVVHTPRWPVVGRRAWVADMDDFGFPFTIGRYALNPAAHEAVRTARDGFRERQAARARAMLAAFAHPSCKAVLFWPRHTLEGARRWLERLGLEDEGRALLEKSHVLYPAQRALYAPLVRRKWQRPQDLHVLFVGRDYQVKNGRWALQAFRELSRTFPGARFTYVGGVPDSERRHVEGLDFRGELPREGVLKLFEQAHVLFHPAREESFGMVLLEAAAHGLAVVAGRGRGMAHVDEILPQGHALLVDRDGLRPEDEPQAFEAALRSLLLEPERASALARAAYLRASEGELSLDARNRLLQRVYLQAAQDPADEGFAWQDLPDGGALQQLSIEGETLSRAVQTYCQRQGLTQLNFSL